MKILQKFNIEYIKKNFFFGLIFNSGNFFSFFFQIILVTFFTQKVITEFSSINSYIAILISAFAYLPMSVSSFIIENKNFKNLYKDIILKILCIIAILLFICLIFHFPIKIILKINSHITLLSSYLFIPAFILFSLPLGIFNSNEKYNLFALAQITPLFLRLLFLISILFFGYIDNTSLIFFGLLISYLLSFVFFKSKSQKYIYDSLKVSVPNTTSTKSFFNNIFLFSLASIIINFFLSFDFIYIKSFFNLNDAATYIRLITFAKIPYFLLSVLVFILLPESIKTSKKDSFELFTYNILIALFFGLFYVPFLFLCLNNLSLDYLDILIKNQSLFLIGNINYSILSMISFQVIFIVSLKKYKYLLVSLIPIILFNFLLFSSSNVSLVNFAFIISISFFIYLIINFICIYIEFKRSKIL